MATTKGASEVRAFIAGLPEQIQKRMLRGAARAAATVVADEAKARVASDAVRGGVSVATRADGDTMRARVFVKGRWENSLGTWLEYGTDPHFISVDPEQSGGRTARRVNTLVKEGSLVIAGKFVGETVFHPGARPHPFLRPALDTRGGEAIAAAQAHIDARVTRGGIKAGDGGDE